MGEKILTLATRTASHSPRFVWCLIGICIAAFAVGSQFWHVGSAQPGVLYSLALVVGSIGSTIREFAVWLLVCCASACMPLLIGDIYPSSASFLDLVVTLVGIGTTAVLVRSRKHARMIKAEKQEARELGILADSVPQILWGTRPDGQCDYLNQRYYEFTGLTAEQAIGKQLWAEPIHPDDRPEMYKKWRTAVETKSSEFRSYGRVYNRLGEYRWMYSVGRAIRSPQTGEVVRWFGSLLDVDAEFRAQETIRELNDELQALVDERTQKLEQTEWRFKALFDERNIGVLEQDLSKAREMLRELHLDRAADIRAHLNADSSAYGRLALGQRTVDINLGLLAMLGYSGREHFLSNPPCDSDPGVQEIFIRQLEAFAEGRDSFRGTTVITGAGGKRVSLAYAVRLKEDGTTYTTMFDISEREHAHQLMLGEQQELARANRLATVGALSVSIVHELNQPVLSMSLDIATGIRILTKDGGETPAVLGLFHRLRENSLRLTGIIQRTRDKITNRPKAQRTLDIAALTRETVDLLDQEAVRHGAKITLSAPTQSLAVSADRVELQQVLVNLIINALDAMDGTPPGGRLVSVKIHQQIRDRVTVSITDTGPGIDEENLLKVFAPFFTTKPNGIGIGLEICRSTIEALGGKLSASSVPRDGATFEFWLPLYLG